MTKNILDKARRLSDEKFEQLIQIALANKGKLLETGWLGDKTLHKFEFEGGTEFFFMTPLNLKDNRNSRNSGWPINHLGVIRKIAEDEGGRLISYKWTNANAEYDFEFPDGTPFSRTASDMKKMGWPPNQDAYLKMSIAMKMTDEQKIDELNDYIEDGRVVSLEWLGNKELHDFEFNDGTTFRMTPDHLKSNGMPNRKDAFLRRSSNNNKGAYHLEYMREIAREYGGELLSDKWEGNKEKYRFKDQANLEFEIQYKYLKRGGWSPNTGLISEPVCRQAMKHLFGKEFHSRWDIVKDRDKEKKDFCDTHNIVLVVVPPFRNNNTWESTYVIDVVKKAVEDVFINKCLSVPILNRGDFKVNMNVIHQSVIELEKIRKIAEDNEGQLLSTE